VTLHAAILVVACPVTTIMAWETFVAVSRGAPLLWIAIHLGGLGLLALLIWLSVRALWRVPGRR